MKLFLTLFALSLPILPLLAQDVPFGEAFLVQETWQEIQQTSSVGKMVARDADGGLHLTWTSMLAEGGARRVSYTYVIDGAGDIGEQLVANTNRADNEARAGYSSLDLRQSGNEEVAVLFFHGSSKGIAAIDFGARVGAFNSIYFDPPGEVIPINSKGCSAGNGTIFLTAGVHNPMAGDPNFVLTLWPAVPNGDNWNIGARTEVEQTTGLSHAIVASSESDRVALVWHHNIIGVPGPEEWAGRLEHQMNNDIYVAIAENGVDWDWDNPINVTRTILPDAEREGNLALGDTLRPYPDLDAIWVGDVLHVVFSAKGFWADLEGNMVPPVNRITEVETLIWHWDSASDTLTLVADGWYENEEVVSGNVGKPSLGADGDGRLYCLFRSMVEGDSYFTDLMLTYSEDGTQWSEPVNLTETHFEQNDERDYIDEDYPSLATRIDESLYLSYLLRADPGDQPVPYQFIYQRVPVADLPEWEPLELPREGFVYHNIEQEESVAIESTLPNEFGLSEIYPNPFNGSATMKIDVPMGREFTLQVIDLTGKVVATFSQGSVGSRSYVWSDDAAPAGVYLFRLSWEGGTVTRKAALLK